MTIDYVGIIKRRIPDVDPSEFMKPDMKPYLKNLAAIRNMMPAVRRLIDALITPGDKPKIVVAGDYDADGICSVAAMSRLLTLFGRPDHHLLLPDRLTEGHGMSAAFTTRLLEQSPDLVIILDCGSTSQTSIQRIVDHASRGAIIMDHHQAPGMAFPDMPGNALLINPALDPFYTAPIDPKIAKGLSELCAGGIVYAFAAQFVITWRAMVASGALNGCLTVDDEDLRVLLTDVSALAAITTITDMAKLTRFNRALVKTCLPYIGRIAGIRAMAKKFKFPLNPDAPKASDVGFKYGPVINASGRIYHGNIALKLLLENDPHAAEDVAAEAIAINDERKSVQQDVVSQCLAAIDIDSDHGHVVRNEDFHPGVVGLAASRILERTGRPAIVIGSGGAASARSIASFDIGAFIHKAVSNGWVTSGGGHHAAGGFRVPEDPESHRRLKEEFIKETHGLMRIDPRPDITVEFGQTIDLQQVYEAFAPYGIGNPPLNILFVNPIIVDESWYGKSQGGEKTPHWKGKIVNGKDEIQAQWFNARSSRFYPTGHDQLRGAYQVRGRIEPSLGWRASGYTLMIESVDMIKPSVMTEPRIIAKKNQSMEFEISF